MRKLFPLALLALLLPSNLLAQEPLEVLAPATSHLTSKGRWLVEGSLSGYWHDFKHPDTNTVVGPEWSMQLQPSVMYFVRDRIGIGGTFGGGFGKRSVPYGEARDRELIIGVTMALDIPLARTISLMFKPSVTYLRTTTVFELPLPPLNLDADGYIPEPGSATLEQKHVRDAIRIGAHLPLLFHVSDAVALGIGPAAWRDFIWSGGSYTRIGASTTILASF